MNILFSWKSREPLTLLAEAGGGWVWVVSLARRRCQDASGRFPTAERRLGSEVQPTRNVLINSKAKVRLYTI